MPNHTTVEQIIDLARQLSPLDKRKILEQLKPDIEVAPNVSPPPTASRSLRGMFKGIRIGEDEIQEARREMWRNFPRQVP